jgi:predicted amidohydrolase YtcJ
MPTDVGLMVVNARPWSDGATVREADAIAVVDGLVAGVGRAADLARHGGPAAPRIDARGATVTPGLWDAHLHLLSWARSRAQVSLRGAAGRDEAVARVRRWSAEHPGTAPLVGRGWDASGWSDLPDRAALDAAIPERAVLLHSKDFHGLWVNSAALREAGVSRRTPDPPGGRFERDATGEPTGVVREHAVRAFAALEARAVVEDDLALARDAVRVLHAHGVVGVHDFDRGPAAHRVLRELAREGALRVLASIGHPELDHALALGLESGTGDDAFRIGPLKLFADGTLGSRTASMLEPYEGGGTGLDLMSPAELRETVARALAGRLAVAVHAIGDRAVRRTLDAFEAAGAGARRAPLPCRVEHVQLLHPDDRPRFAALGIAASLQPLHCTADLELVERHWGERRARAYPWRTLLASGTRLAFGSDAPVESPSVAASLHAAVTRTRADGTPAGGFVPGECVTLDEALTAHTEAPARLAGSWPRIGRLAPGAAADLVVWDRDLHATPAAELVHARPACTVIGGRVVRRAEVAAPAAAGEAR